MGKRKLIIIMAIFLIAIIAIAGFIYFGYFSSSCNSWVSLSVGQSAYCTRVTLTLKANQTAEVRLANGTVRDFRADGGDFNMLVRISGANYSQMVIYSNFDAGLNNNYSISSPKFFIGLKYFAAGPFHFSSCTGLNVSTPEFTPGGGMYGVWAGIINGVSITATCHWSGGTLYVYGGGDGESVVPEWPTVTVIGANGQTYFNKSVGNDCPGYVGSFNAPAQNYTLVITVGPGGGNCGNTEVLMLDYFNITK